MKPLRQVQAFVSGLRRRMDSVAFSTRLAVWTSGLLLASCVTLSWTLVQRDLDEAWRNQVERGRTISEYLASEAELGVLSGDADGLRRQAERAVGQHRLVYCRYLDEKKQVLAASGEGPATPSERSPEVPVGHPVQVAPDIWEFQAPVQTTHVPLRREEVGLVAPTQVLPGQRKEVGTVAIGVSTQPLMAMRRRVFWTTALLTALVTLVGILVASLLASAIGRPLRALARAADSMARGTPEVAVEVRTKDEIGALANSFNTMVATLTQSRRRLEEYNQTLEERVSARTERLETLNRELQEANLLKSEFLATVSHELRTPLNVILGYSAMLAEGAGGEVTPQQLELLQAIERYSKLQLDLINNVLDFSRLTSGKTSLHIEPFELAPMLADLMALYEVRYGRGSVRLECEVESSLPTLRTDRIKLQEIIRNLVDNAMKFTESGRVAVRARLGEKGSDVLIVVEDTGPGIAPEELPVIFDPFRQVGGSSSTRKEAGVGLGLSIVKRLVEVLGGEISVTSVLGKGSCFRVVIPLRLDAAQAEANTSQDGALAV